MTIADNGISIPTGKVLPPGIWNCSRCYQFIAKKSIDIGGTASFSLQIIH